MTANDVESGVATNGPNSRVVSDHILNLIQDLEGRLPADREQMISRLETFLALSPEEQVLYRVGRRQGLFLGLGDMLDPQRRALAERLRDQLGVDAENVDLVTDELVKRFI